MSEWVPPCTRLSNNALSFPDAECKHRWRNIRKAFSRYIRSRNTPGSGEKKPYYLWDHLQYLVPYIHTKSKLQSHNIGISSPSQQRYMATDFQVDNLEDQLEEDSTGKSEKEMPVGDYVPPSPPGANTPSSSLSSWRSSKSRVKSAGRLEKALTNYFEKIGNDRDPIATADLNFLTSLLPDVTSLPQGKKRMFKIKVLEILDELSEDNLASGSNIS